LVESLINDLVKANMIVRGEEPKGLVLAQAPDHIAVVDVLKVVQHQPHSGPQGFAVGTDIISRVLLRRDAAVESALEGITLMSLIKNPSGTLEQDAGWESSSEMGRDAAAQNESLQDATGYPSSLQEKSSADFPTRTKWRSD